MATDGQSEARTFNEVVFRGGPKVARAFLSGLLLGSGRQAMVFDSLLDGVRHEGKAVRLAGMIGMRGSNCHLIVDAATAQWLEGLARSMTAETGLVIAANRRIRSALMDLQYKAFSKRHEDEIMNLLGNLPSGLKLEGFRHEVRVDPDASGIEAYAAAHEFEATGTGAIAGEVDLLIALKKQLVQFPLIQATDIELCLD